MKLVLAIVNSDDSNVVQTELTKAGFSATKMATTGGFLMAGNTTFMIGADDDKAAEVVGLIKRFSQRRNQVIPSTNDFGTGLYGAFPSEVTVGGATIFVLDVEQFEKA